MPECNRMFITSITKELSGTKIAECNEIMSKIKQIMNTKGAMWLHKKN